jgi:hypothetical protein
MKTLTGSLMDLHSETPFRLAALAAAALFSVSANAAVTPLKGGANGGGGSAVDPYVRGSKETTVSGAKKFATVKYLNKTRFEIVPAPETPQGAAIRAIKQATKYSVHYCQQWDGDRKGYSLAIHEIQDKEYFGPFIEFVISDLEGSTYLPGAGKFASPDAPQNVRFRFYSSECGPISNTLFGKEIPKGANLVLDTHHGGQSLDMLPPNTEFSLSCRSLRRPDRSVNHPVSYDILQRATATGSREEINRDFGEFRSVEYQSPSVTFERAHDGSSVLRVSAKWFAQVAGIEGVPVEIPGGELNREYKFADTQCGNTFAAWARNDGDSGSGLNAVPIDEDTAGLTLLRMADEAFAEAKLAATWVKKDLSMPVFYASSHFIQELEKADLAKADSKPDFRRGMARVRLSRVKELLLKAAEEANESGRGYVAGQIQAAAQKVNLFGLEFPFSQSDSFEMPVPTAKYPGISKCAQKDDACWAKFYKTLQVKVPVLR